MIMMATVERITRTIFRPCKGLLVKHQVVFGSKDQAQKRRGELYTYEYNSSRYSDVTKLSSLTLETSDFLYLEKTNWDKEVDNEKIFLSYPHLFKMKRAFKEILTWFYSDKYEPMFIYKDNDIIFNSDFRQEKVEIYNLVGNKGIVIVPDVIEIETQLYEGITMFLNSQDQYVQMTIDQIEALYDFFLSFNLYQSSQMLINYVTNINSENIKGSGFNPKGGKTTGGKMPLNKKKKKKESKGDKEE
jgi:hypothetical protein